MGKISVKLGWGTNSDFSLLKGPIYSVLGTLGCGVVAEVKVV